MLDFWFVPELRKDFKERCFQHVYHAVPHTTGCSNVAAVSHIPQPASNVHNKPLA